MLVIICSYEAWKAMEVSCRCSICANPSRISVAFTASASAFSTVCRMVQKLRGVNCCAVSVTACCAKRMYEVSHSLPNVRYTSATRPLCSLYWKEMETAGAGPASTALGDKQAD